MENVTKQFENLKSRVFYGDKDSAEPTQLNTIFFDLRPCDR